ncbi:MAG: protein meaA [Myxococcales bacterium]|nr:protein meaA [Myxococcales bacterium]
MPKLNDRAPWLIRTYAGFGDATQSNARFRENLARGQQGLSVAFDLPTQCGYDSDDPLAAGEVGGTGVAIDHIGDMEALFDQLDLSQINTSMTINATAPWLFALYVALADKQGVPRDALRGTTQNDLLKEFVGRGTHIFAPEPSLKLCTDLIVFSSREVPGWNPTNACGYHYMESGAGPAQEIGFAIGNALMMLDAIRPQLDEKAFASVVKRISFFINSGIELVPEIAKMRAYTQLWTEVCESEYGVQGVKFRAGCQVRSLTLTEQQPEVNIVRIAYESLPVILSANARVRALQLPGFREAIGLPDQAEQTLSLRTQQVLMYETGVADYEDIFEGSHVIERETSKTKAEALRIATEIRSIGFGPAIQHIAERLTAGLVEQSAALETGDVVRVGVNAFLDEVGITPKADFSEDVAAKAAAAEGQVERLRQWRAQRDADAVERARQGLLKAARDGENIVPSSIEFAKAGGTTGEWTKTLEEAFGGRYQAPLGLDVAVSRSVRVPKVDFPCRILLAKGGLDGHVNAVKLLAFACRQAGMEVVYSGLQQTPTAIAAAAVQEDVDIVGVSSLAGAHVHIAESVLASLKERGADDIPFVIGGIVPEEDHQSLFDLGVSAVFTPKDGDVFKVVESLIELARAKA